MKWTPLPVPQRTNIPLNNKTKLVHFAKENQPQPNNRKKTKNKNKKRREDPNSKRGQTNLLNSTLQTQPPTHNHVSAISQF
jgi:hypothetical protein